MSLHEQPVGVSTELLSQNLPEVSFDIRIGKRVEFIDFDYAAYMQHLRSNTVNDIDIANTAIYFEAKSRLPTLEVEYDPDLNLIYTHIGRKRNAHLVHETQHRIQDVHGSLDAYSRKIKRINAAFYYGKWVLGGGSLAIVPVSLVNADLSTAAFGTSILGALLCVGSSNAFRYLAPERQARNAEKEVTTSFVSVIKKRRFKTGKSKVL